MTLIDDSGPPIPDDNVLARCLQQIWRDLWGADEAIPAACTGCFDENGDGFEALPAFLTDQYPDAHFGLVSSTGDEVIRIFFGYGDNDCRGAITIDERDYRQGLLNLRDDLLAPTEQWASFLVGGMDRDQRTNHVWLMPDADYVETEIEGANVQSWVGDLLEGNLAHIGP